MHEIHDSSLYYGWIRGGVMKKKMIDVHITTYAHNINHSTKNCEREAYMRFEC